MCMEANYDLPEDVYAALKRGREAEESPVGKAVFDQLVENADIARRDRVPICQDTGFAVFFVNIGQDVHLVGGDFEAAVNEGVRQGYTEGYLRKSIAEEPAQARRNTKDNTPAVDPHADRARRQGRDLDDGQGRRRREHEQPQHAQAVAGLGGHGAGGAGHRLESRLQPLPADHHRRGHRRHHRHGHACWPRRHSCAISGRKHPDERIAAMEDELLARINALGIGPQGLGGTQTCSGRVHRGDALPHRQHADGRQRAVPRAAPQARGLCREGRSDGCQEDHDAAHRRGRRGPARRRRGADHRRHLPGARRRPQAARRAHRERASRCRSSWRARSSTTWGRRRPSPGT